MHGTVKKLFLMEGGQNPVFADCQDAVYREILASSIIDTHQTCRLLALLVDLDCVNSRCQYNNFFSSV